MRTFLCYTALLLFVSSLSARDLFIYPGFYWTAGEFSGSRESDEFAGYLTVSENDFHFLSFGYSALDLSEEDWNYRQRFGVIGASVAQYSTRIRLHYGHLSGDFDFDLYDLHYTEQADFYSAEVLRTKRNRGIGIGYHRYHLVGPERYIAQGWQLRLGWNIGKKSRITLKPLYTRVNDGRDLFSCDVELSHRLGRKFDVTFGGMLGERAFYFDNDLLTLDNQFPTLNGRGFAKAVFQVTRRVWLTGEYLHSRYRDYSVNYFVAGISGRFQVGR